MSKKIVTQLRIDDEIYNKAKLIAYKELRSMNNQLEYFILRGIIEYEKNNDINLEEQLKEK